MSVEALTIAAVIDQGSPALRRLYAAGISNQDFALYDEEFKWIERRLSQRKTLNRRVFRERFVDFEWAGVPKEDIADLAAELKEERAFTEVTAILETLSESLERDNAVELAMQMREHLTKVTRKFTPMSDIDLDDYEHVIEEMKQGMLLAKQGMSPGLPTGFAHLDHHWGGIMPGKFIQLLGRTGEGKSYMMIKLGWTARKGGFRIGLFTPEMNEHEVRSRYHTLASADKDVQKALDLERSFRNRALLFRRGFNVKAYQRFCEYLREMPGRFHLLCGAGMSDQMSVGYIEDRMVELELDLVLIDPIYLLKPVRMTREGNSYQETAWIGEALHRLSEQYQVPIVFSNQAHLDGGAKGDAPHHDRGFGAKALVHMSDYSLGVKHMSEENLLIGKGSKSRFGSGGWRFESKFYANTGVFKELTPIKGNYMNGADDPEEDEVREMIANATKGED